MGQPHGLPTFDEAAILLGGRFNDVIHLHHFTQLTSCVGDNSCGVGSPVWFGATYISDDDGEAV